MLLCVVWFRVHFEMFETQLVVCTNNTVCAGDAYGYNKSPVVMYARGDQALCVSVCNSDVDDVDDDDDSGSRVASGHYKKRNKRREKKERARA